MTQLYLFLDWFPVPTSKPADGILSRKIHRKVDPEVTRRLLEINGDFLITELDYVSRDDGILILYFKSKSAIGDALARQVAKKAFHLVKAAMGHRDRNHAPGKGHDPVRLTIPSSSITAQAENSVILAELRRIARSDGHIFELRMHSAQLATRGQRRAILALLHRMGTLYEKALGEVDVIRDLQRASYSNLPNRIVFKLLGIAVALVFLFVFLEGPPEVSTGQSWFTDVWSSVTHARVKTWIALGASAIALYFASSGIVARFAPLKDEPLAVLTSARAYLRWCTVFGQIAENVSQKCGSVRTFQAVAPNSLASTAALLDHEIDLVDRMEAMYRHRANTGLTAMAVVVGLAAVLMGAVTKPSPRAAMHLPPIHGPPSNS